ncbi:MAG: hypothetical protein KGH59_04675 [Candidatus Micrarchaeota archaeon]|nr:hypothetical protein [Candidatus Micrarchaeota archaeon]
MAYVAEKNLFVRRMQDRVSEACYNIRESDERSAFQKMLLDRVEYESKSWTEGGLRKFVDEICGEGNIQELFVLYNASPNAAGQFLRRIGVNISLNRIHRNEQIWENAKLWGGDYKGLFLRLDVDEMKEGLRDLQDKVEKIKNKVGNSLIF